MFAMGTAGLDRTVSEIRSRGIDMGDPVPGRREAGETPGYTWKSSNLAHALPGTECFLIQHDRTVAERYTQPPNPTSHPNGVTGIHHVSLAVQDAESAATRWRAVLGLDFTEPPSAAGEVRRRVALDNACIKPGVSHGVGAPGRLHSALRRGPIRAHPPDTGPRGHCVGDAFGGVWSVWRIRQDTTAPPRSSRRPSAPA